MILFGLCVLLVAVSGVPGLWSRTWGAKAAPWLLAGGALAGLAAAGRVLIGGASVSLALPHTPLGTQGFLRLDPIGAWFLVPVLVLPACGAVFARGYWDGHFESARRLRLLFGITAASMAVLVAAAHALTFLMAWEGMAVTSFFLVTAEDRDADTRRAGWIYLASTHTGTLCLFGAFALMAGSTYRWLAANPGASGSQR